MTNYDDFLANIMRTLEKNGYPGKRVALPLVKMYEVAYEKGLNFNKALTLLDEKGVAHEKTEQKVIFFSKALAAAEAAAAESGQDFGDMMAKAKEMVDSMSPEQREELMRKAKEMGLL